MNYFSPFVLVILVVFTSCKKDEKTTPIKNNGNNTSTNIYTYGSLSTILRSYYNGNTLSNTDSTAYAFFVTDPLNPSTTMVNCGNVTYNGSLLQNYSNNYISNSLNIHQPNSVWAVSGSTVVPVINYTISPNYPVFTGNNQLPDSFSISNGFTINLIGISNFSNSGILIEIADGANSVFKNLSSNQTSYSFSAADLNILQPTISGGAILLTFNNTIIQSYYEKNYFFISSLEHYKYNIKIKS